MKQLVLPFLLVIVSVASLAQSAPKASTPAAKPATAAHPAAGVAKLPPGIPPAKALTKTLYTVSLRYQDIKIGAGEEAKPGQIIRVHYTGWRAADGAKFDSSYDHRAPILDKDRKPELGPDGTPKLGEPQPLAFAQGRGQLIVGFDQGVVGMHVGGKRRIFIPWQLAYGTRNIPDHGPEHPGIPSKSDLIFDVELVSVMDMPPPAASVPHPPMPTQPGAAPHATPAPATATPAPAADKPATAPAPTTQPAPAKPDTPQH